MGADTKANTTLGGGAPQRGHGAPLEPLAQLGDAQGRVDTIEIAIIILPDAAELVVGQAAKERRRCQWALTRKRTLGWRRT